MIKALALFAVLGFSAAHADPPPNFDFSISSGGFSISIESPDDMTPIFKDFDDYQNFQRRGKGPKWGDRDKGRVTCDVVEQGRGRRKICVRECVREQATCYVKGTKNGRSRVIEASASSVRRAKFEAAENCYRQGYRRCEPFRRCEVGQVVISEREVSCRGHRDGWDGNQGGWN